MIVKLTKNIFPQNSLNNFILQIINYFLMYDRIFILKGSLN